MMNVIYTFHVRYQCLALLLFFSTLHVWGQEARVSLTDAQVTGDSPVPQLEDGFIVHTAQ